MSDRKRCRTDDALDDLLRYYRAARDARERRFEQHMAEAFRLVAAWEPPLVLRVPWPPRTAPKLPLFWSDWTERDAAAPEEDG